MQQVFHHQMPAQLRFSDVDRFGHVNNTVYFSLFDMCKTKYFLSVLGMNIFDRCATVVAGVKANFLSPIYYPDEIVIETAIVHIGNKSVTIKQQAVNKRTREVKCECETVMVFFDTKENHSIVIPQEYRERIEKYEHIA